jgi:DNA-binding GntR family transcriptional regulator
MNESKTTIETRSLGEQVYNHLCDMIIDGNIDYGQTLNIKQLAEELNVSPMPVREAIKRLEVEGLVVIKPRSMCILREPTAHSVANAIAMREILETYCVESVYREVAPERLENLREITEKMRALMRRYPSTSNHTSRTTDNSTRNCAPSSTTTSSINPTGR